MTLPEVLNLFKILSETQVVIDPYTLAADLALFAIFGVLLYVAHRQVFGSKVRHEPEPRTGHFCRRSRRRA